MFYGCATLTSISGLSSFNTSKVTSMQQMFHNCLTLPSLDLSNFDTSNVTSMRLMFDSCDALRTLDLSSFDFSNVTDKYNMLYRVKNCTIYVKDSTAQTFIKNDTALDSSCTVVIKS